MDSKRDIREKPSAGMNSPLPLCSLFECLGHTLSPLPRPPIMGLRETCFAPPVLNRAGRTVYVIQCLCVFLLKLHLHVFATGGGYVQGRVLELVPSFLGFTCPQPSGNNQDSDKPLNYPHPKEPTKYFSCQNGRPRLHTCPRPFDAATSLCVGAENEEQS
ncbi:unnamed protein product [Bemisia tabaci]|uniref:Chitin-binding type-2 domain-containing protein n=1 Tax=Bemisia tabaci TaxID=7038 RepID=A0A9P0EZQ4_BEMTA|nr:unnamed protein product [Bemisia tabaci]